MDRIVLEEADLLARVRALIAEAPYLKAASDQDVVGELVRLRDEMPRAKEEDKPALIQQYEQLYYQMTQLRAAADLPQVNADSPYFGHLRLREKGRDRDVCIGKATRIDNGLRIIDWRNAPLSKIFYSYQQGEEYEEEIGDRVHEGVVLARRTVTIENGDLHRVDAPEGTFLVDESAEGGWRREARETPRLAGGEQASAIVHETGGGDRRLGTDLAGSRRRSDKRLPDIAGLIDPDQFRLITQPTGGFLVIRGTAGSGKTTVALHRIAWLAFEDPSVDSPDTMFVVFSRALRDYVGNVLPRLGVQHVRVSTWGEWASDLRRSHFPMLPRRSRDDTPSIVNRLKLHPVMLAALEEQVGKVNGPSTPDQAWDDWASVITQLDVIRSVVERHAPTAFTEEELRRATQWCRERHEELLAWMDGDRETEVALDDEDDALLLRAWQLRVGPLRNKRTQRALRYRHIAVDEVQDFTPIDVRVLLDCLDERQSITLAGDTQQHVMKDAGFTSWSEFFGYLGVKGTAVETLRVAYRSSREIVTFAMGLLGDLREDDTPPLTVRSGPPVELFRFTDHGQAIAVLADALRDLMRAEPFASVVLLSPSVSASTMYFEGLKKAEVPRLRQVTEEDFSFRPGIEITEVSQVKGLEFDYVILVDASQAAWSDTPSARRLLHVAASRAVHQLWVTSVGTPSVIIRQAIEDL